MDMILKFGHIKVSGWRRRWYNFDLPERNTGNNCINKSSFVHLEFDRGLWRKHSRIRIIMSEFNHKRLLKLFGGISLHHGITPGNTDQDDEEIY